MIYTVVTMRFMEVLNLLKVYRRTRHSETYHDRQIYGVVQNKLYRYNEREITGTLVTKLYKILNTEIGMRNLGTTQNKIRNIMHKSSSSTIRHANHTRNLQNFIHIKYKEEEIRINVTVQKNGHTSKFSFPDKEEIERHDTNMGEKIKNETFRTEDSTIVHADLNSQYNIMKKTIPEAFASAIGSTASCPQTLSIRQMTTSKDGC